MFDTQGDYEKSFLHPLGVKVTGLFSIFCSKNKDGNNYL